MRRRIEAMTRGYPDRAEYFVDRLARGIGKLAAPFHPNPVIVRLSDFKTNEYAHLVGGAEFEPAEENPMLGLRGASRYYSDRYRDGFALECRAIRRVREEIGLTNVVVMVPFCRTPAEADRLLTKIKEKLRGPDPSHLRQIRVLLQDFTNQYRRRYVAPRDGLGALEAAKFHFSG